MLRRKTARPEALTALYIGQMVLNHKEGFFPPKFLKLPAFYPLDRARVALREGGYRLEKVGKLRTVWWEAMQLKN